MEIKLCRTFDTRLNWFVLDLLNSLCNKKWIRQQKFVTFAISSILIRLEIQMISHYCVCCKFPEVNYNRHRNRKTKKMELSQIFALDKQSVHRNLHGTNTIAVYSWNCQQTKQQFLSELWCTCKTKVSDNFQWKNTLTPCPFTSIYCVGCYKQRLVCAIANCM